jgi:hypothetical protein
MYFAHSKFCDPCSIFSQRYRNFLDKYPVLPNILLYVPWSSQHPLMQTIEGISEALSMHLHQSIDPSPSDDGCVVVGALLYEQMQWS